MIINLRENKLSFFSVFFLSLQLENNGIIGSEEVCREVMIGAHTQYPKVKAKRYKI